MYEFLFETCILRCLNYVWKKFPNDYTIWVYFIFSVPYKKCVFDNLEHTPPLSFYILMFVLDVDYVFPFQLFVSFNAFCDLFSPFQMIICDMI